MIRSFPEPAAGHARAGFTLVEILVALVISSLIVGSIFQVLQGNGRFVEMQSAREEVQQNARAALELIAADLRAVPPAAIVEMEVDRIRFLQPRAWGVVCNTLGPSTPAAWILFPAGVLPAEEPFARPHWGIGIEQSPDPLVRSGSYRFVAEPTRQTTGDPCDALQPTPSAQRVRLGFRTPGAPLVTADTVPPGTPAMLFEEIAYDVAASAGGAVPGSWIRRMAGYIGAEPNMQPMAGPVPARGALSFTYLQADGATTATTPAEVRQIAIRVVAQSRATRRTGGGVEPQQMDTASTVVSLRNLP